ncbi:MAG: glycosyltransferase [bacterium]
MDWSDCLKLRGQFPTTREIEGQLYYLAFQNWNRLTDFEGKIEFPKQKNALLFGLGSKQRAKKLLNSGQNQRLYEPDPHRLHIFISNYEQELKEKNWKLGCGLWFDEDFFSEPLVTVAHPYLRKQYAPLHTLLEQWTRQKSLPKKLLICQTGSLFYRDVLDTLGEEKNNLFPFNTAHWQPAALKEMFALKSGSTFFSINLIEGLPELAAQSKINYICWEIDPATSPYQKISEAAARSSRIYSYRKKNLLLLKAAGYTRIKYLPLAANPTLRRPLADQKIDNKYRAAVSFVGSSLKANADRLLNLIMRWVNKQRTSSKTGDWATFQKTLTDWLTEFPDWRENTLELIEDKLQILNIPLQETIAGEPLSLAMAIAEYRAYRKRIDVVRTIGEHYPIKVWGDDGWTGQTGPRGEYCGPAGHEDELTAIYNGSNINLDIGRIYQPEIITMRVFDVMSCGGVVLSEDRAAIRELLQPDKDCVLYREKDDLLEKINHLLENPEIGRKIGAAARKNILNSHTIKHRLQEMNLLPK